MDDKYGTGRRRRWMVKLLDEDIRMIVQEEKGFSGNRHAFICAHYFLFSQAKHPMFSCLCAQTDESAYTSYLYFCKLLSHVHREGQRHEDALKRRAFFACKANYFLWLALLEGVDFSL